jgi:hypothetical protein
MAGAVKYSLPGDPVKIARGGTCRADGCDKPIHERGFCTKHYYRLKAYGDPFGKRTGPHPNRGRLAWNKGTGGCKKGHDPSRYVNRFGKMTCLDCRDIHDAAYRLKHRDKILPYSQLFRHGLSRHEYDAMIASQDNKCAICRTEFRHDRPTRKESRKEARTPYIDHSHSSNRIRGLLCHRCNTGLGMFLDSPSALKAAIEYLEGKR